MNVSRSQTDQRQMDMVMGLRRINDEKHPDDASELRGSSY